MIPHKYTTIMAGLVVRWRFSPQRDVGYDAEINASRDGVSICGCWPIMKSAQLGEALDAIVSAQTVYRRLCAGDPLDDIPSAPVFGTPNLEPDHLRQDLGIDNSDDY
jgi:hypothetical protein